MIELGIAVEGESDKKIVEEILKKLGIEADFVLPPHGGGKTNLFENLENIIFEKLSDYRKRIILVDYDNSKKWETEFKSKTECLKKKPGAKNKEIILHFARQEVEAWLLGCYPKDILKDVENIDPDNAIKPYRLIENFEKKKRNDKNFCYNKTADGKRIAERNNLNHFRHSESFKKFEEILK